MGQIKSSPMIGIYNSYTLNIAQKNKWQGG